MSTGAAPAAPAARAVLVVCALLALAAPAAAQQADDELVEALRAELAAERAAREALAAELLRERAARQALEGRVAALEADGGGDGIEAQLRALMEPEAFVTAPPRTSFLSDFNPSIAVYTDALVEAGDEEDIGEDDGDRFSLRELEIDARAPISPWADGVLVLAFEDVGKGESETRIEEAYADIHVGQMLDVATDSNAKVGRFRVAFGATNRLHTHDLPQVDRPLVVQRLLGEEGLVGDGIELMLPVSHRETDAGRGRTSTAVVAVVNGDMLAKEESALGELAGDGGLELDSDAPMILARWSEYWELDALSDLELGASYSRDLGGEAVQTDAGTEIRPQLYGLDATWRSRGDESLVGSWLVQGELIGSELDFGGDAVGGLPSGTERARGYYVMAQRQMSPNTYVGLRVGETDGLVGSEEVRAISPYVSWYADEFFRVRLQGQHLDVNDGASGDESVVRAFLQFTWNFGFHQPHPYWVNR